MMVPDTLLEGVLLYPVDCRDALKAIADNSIDSCVTDPPYALVSIVKRFGSPNAAPARSNGATGVYQRASAGFMGKSWDTGETAFTVEFWSEVYRVLKPGAFVAAFGASRGYHRLACAIEDAGFEIRDSLMWLYGTGFPKSHDVSKGIDKAAGVEREKVRYAPRPESSGTFSGASDSRPWIEEARRVGYHEVDSDTPATPEAAEWQGWGTALKPAFEPIVLARKPLSEGTVAANVLRWRTGALNIDGCRIESTDSQLAEKYASVQKAGPRENSIYGIDNRNRAGSAPHAAGRWPANVIHDGSDEVVGMFPDTAPAKAGKRNAPKLGGTFGDYAGDDAERFGHVDSGGSAARFFYSAKASKADRAGSKHPTIKPVSLMRWLCRLVTPPGGTVLDPFAGSGTTGAAALAEGFSAILCEWEDEYVADIRRRLAQTKRPETSAQLFMFEEAPA